MKPIAKKSSHYIRALGRRLRTVRIQRGQSMAAFSQTLGISTAALRSMESGRPGVSIGQWAEVLRRLKRLSELDLLLSDPGPQSLYLHQVHQRYLRSRTVRHP